MKMLKAPIVAHIPCPTPKNWKKKTTNLRRDLEEIRIWVKTGDVTTGNSVCEIDPSGRKFTDRFSSMQDCLSYWKTQGFH